MNKLKPFSLALLMGFAGLQTQAQSWTQNIDEENPTFHDYQDAFYEFWGPYNVKNAYYIEDGEKHKAPGWKQFKRWEHYWAPRVGPSGEFPSNTVDCDAWQEYEENRDGFAKAGSSNWESLGPNVNSVGGIGRVNCIAFHPNDLNTFWVGTPAGGLWKTTNGGSSWTTNTDQLPVLGVSSIAIHPNNPNIMYIATGDGDMALSLSAFGQPHAGDTKSIGILKSTDGGNSWSSVLSAEQYEGILIRKLIIDPNYPDYLFAATSVGIYGTSDAGANWQQMLVGYYTDIEFHPTNTDIIYAASYDPNGFAQVYTSYDIGSTWGVSTNLSGVNRIEIEVSHTNPDCLDILCSDAQTNALHSLYYSCDQAFSWNPYFFGGPGSNLLGWMGDASDNAGQGNYDLAFAIDPNNYDNILVGGVNTWRTNDAGANWYISSIWTNESWVNPPPNAQIAHADHHDLVFHPTQANWVFDVNDGGVYKSTNGGQTWTDISNGLVISQMYSISSSQTSVGTVAAGLQDNGAVGLDGGSWVELTGGDGMICHVDPTDAAVVYTSYANGVLYRLDFNNNTETTISENLPGGQQPGEWVTPYLLDPSNPNTVYAGYESLYRSNNRGDNWVQLGTPAPGFKMNYLAVAPSNPNVIYAGYLTGLFRSDDGGFSWSDVTWGLPLNDVYLSGISVDQYDAGAVIATLSGYSGGNKVYFTSDGGGNWQNATYSGLPNLPVNCSVIDAYDGSVYVGTDAGIYKYDSNNWIPFNNGLPNVVVTDLDIQYGNGLLRAGTFGRGLWETALTVGIEEGAEYAGNILLYPNPNQGQLTLQSENLLDPIQEVEVRDLSGKLVHQQSTEGYRDRVLLELSDLAPGMYLATTRTAKHTVNKRFVVE